MTKKTVLALAALSFLLVPFLALAGPTSFAVVSDTHVGAPDSVYTEFIRIMDEKQIKVIIHAGDAINNPGRTRQWGTFFQITGPDKILHLAPGNHDIHGKNSLAVYLKFFPKLYYSFSDGDTHFILLNTELPGEESRIAGEQLEWLKVELQRPFKYKFVILHEPPFPFVPGHALDRYAEARDRLHSLFEQQGVSLVVSGHDHIYNRSMKGGIIYVIAAGGGGLSRSVEQSLFGFRYIMAARTDRGWAFIVKDMEGHTADEFVISR